MNEVDKFEKRELAWNNKPVRNTEEEVIAMLAPMFALFPQTGADENTFSIYVKMLRDLDPQVLSKAVLGAMNSCKFLPSVAEIREQIETRPPGPRSESDLSRRRPAPQKMFKLSPEEDKAARMAQLRRTKDWRYA